jgi:hypothetical protein
MQTEGSLGCSVPVLILMFVVWASEIVPDTRISFARIVIVFLVEVKLV